jgi:hypothetical protein
LFSPQHWAQEQNDHAPKRNGTWQATFHDHVVLVWDQENRRRTIPLDKANVASFMTSAGSKSFRTFRAFDNAGRSGHDRDLEAETTVFNAMEVTDDEDDGYDTDKEESNTAQAVTEKSIVGTTENDPGFDDTSGHHQTSYDAYERHANVVDDDVHQTNGSTLDATGELLLWHYRMGHLPFSRLQVMASDGSLPSRLKGCRVPKCSACIYGKMTRRPKRTKGATGRIGSTTATRPGECVSVDQLESSTLGLIGHMKGKPTTQRYKCATIYVDHFSRLSYVHLQRTLTSEETVQGKMAFEKFCDSHGILVRNYHADNGRFADKGFVNHATASRQTITYCGVNAHFQNGIAEKRIRDLQEQTTTMLLHAESKWPKAVSASLWPYALRAANDSMNATPAKGTGHIAVQLFGNTNARPMLKYFHPFGCPVYVLHNKLAAGQSIKKWHKRARLGIYLGRSHQHAQSVALVLSLTTGLVSPQFHVAFDDLFETVKDHDNYDNTWQHAAHFRKNTGQASRISRLDKHQVTLHQRILVAHVIGVMRSQSRRGETRQHNNNKLPQRTDNH